MPPVEVANMSPPIEDEAGPFIDSKKEMPFEDEAAPLIDAEKEGAFMEKVKRQMIWFTSSVVAVDHGMMNWRTQVIHNFNLKLTSCDDEEDRRSIEFRRTEMISRIHDIRRELRTVLRARDSYVKLVEQQKINSASLEERETKYVEFCTETIKKLDEARCQIDHRLKPALKQIERENGFPRRAPFPAYKGRVSPLSFARRELGLIP